MKRKTRTKLFATAITSLAMAFTLGVGGMVASADDTATETKVLDFNGTEISTTYSNGTKVNADNIYSLFAGKTGEGKCYSLNYAEGTPITFTFASALTAADYTMMTISICVSNWVGGTVTTGVYAMTDTTYTNCAGSVGTGYGNKTATLTLDASKLANSEGKIEGFVVVPTGISGDGIMGYFDDVVLTLAEKEEEGTVFEGVLDFDGVAVSSSSGSVKADSADKAFPSKTGEGYCIQATPADNTPITFTFKKTLKAADYDEIILTWAMNNWTGAGYTLSVYSLSDTEYANAAGSYQRTSSFNGMHADMKMSLDASKLADANGDIKGFVVLPQVSGTAIGVYFDDIEFIITTQEFTKTSLTLNESLTVNYVATVESASEVKARFTINDYTVEADGVATGNADEYKFAFEGVAPQWMGDTITAELFADGKVVQTKEHSVLSYCTELLGKTAADLDMSESKLAALKTLVADVLDYGAAAQMYTEYKTDALVNAGITGASTYVELTESNRAISGTALDTASFAGVTVAFNNVNKLYFRINATDITGVTVTVTIGGVATTYTNADFVKESDGVYGLYTEAIKATQFDEEVTAVMSQGETQGQTVTYGVKAYVYVMQNGGNAMAELAKATYKYGVSAVAYQNAQ